MGEMIIRKVRGMNWKAKIALVLVFTMVFSTFMYQGWYKPKQAQAAITTVTGNDWSEIFTNTNAFPSTISYSVGTGSNANRMLVVALASTIDTAGAQTCSVTYGTQDMVMAVSDGGSTQSHAYLFYLNEAGLDAATNSDLVFTCDGLASINHVYATVYDGVDQSGSPLTNSRGNTGTTSVALTTGLTIASGDQAVEVVNMNRTGGTTYRTISTPATNWTNVISSANSNDGTIYNSADLLTSTTASAADTANHSISSTSSSIYAMAAMSIKQNTCTDSDPATLTITNPTSSSTVGGTVTIQVQVGTETAPSGMTGMHVDIANAGACSVTGGTMTWNIGNSLWEYSWDTSACGTSTPVTGVTVDASGTDPDCSTTVNAAQITSVTIDNSKPPSTITDCAGCHGYTSNFDDGTGRNNPDGTFVGSHNAHVISEQIPCSTCHVVPASETGADHAHRNGRIQMAVPINGESGANYGNWKTNWAQTNSPQLASCAGLYCHSQGAGWTSNVGDTRSTSSPAIWLTWGNSGTCASCHGNPPNYANGTTTWGAAKANSHAEHNMPCQYCHAPTTTNGSTITGPALHGNRLYNIGAFWGSGSAWSSIGSYTYAIDGGVCNNISCHDGANAKWGTVGSIPAANNKCIYCHDSTTLVRTKVSQPYMMDNVVAEFKKQYGHWNTSSGPLDDGVCVVCHLEGRWGTYYGSGTVIRTTYHADGNIDLRDPDGAGETPITDMNNNAWTFQRFSDSFAAGSRWTTYYTANVTANIITQKFCLGCHDSNGATNPLAWNSNGGTRDPLMPFGGISLGANYTTVAGAASPGKIVNVRDQFWTSHTSVHPIRGPLVRDFPTPARMAAPYNNFTRLGMSTIVSAGVTMNCFDCHNSSSSPLTGRTIVAHGNNTEMIRGTIYTNYGAGQLCYNCHTTYTSSTSNHQSGSAWSAQGSSHNTTLCSQCHGSTNTGPVRPLRAQDYHGFSWVSGGGQWLGTGGTPITGKPYAFIRNVNNFYGHRPFRDSQHTSGSATCQGGTGRCAGQNGTASYTPGGTF